jgi:TetR/AcrR family transcriptional regulator
VSQPPQNQSAGRDEILRAATDLFAESGFDAVSMNSIAVRAGTSKANVFHHFGSKDALYLAVMRDACGRFETSIDAFEGEDRDFAQRLSGFVREDLQAMAAQSDYSHLILREILDSGPRRGQALATEVFDQAFGRIVAVLEQAQARGEVSAEVPPALAASMLLACNVFMFQSQHVLKYLPGVDFVDDPERYAALVGRVLSDGLRPRDAGRGGEGDHE